VRTRGIFVTGLALAFALGIPSTGRALVTSGIIKNVPFVIAFRPLNSQQIPYTGQLRLNFHDGIISGTYTDLSIRPGSPFANANNLSVSGGVSGVHVTLNIRQLTFHGTVHENSMSGSVMIRGAMYSWDAQRGTPGSGKKHTS